jgi:large subunit ribosomal protein L24
MMSQNKKFKIKKDDTVIVIAGKDKGKQGKVLKVLRAADRVLVSGVNEVKKHMKPSKANKGGIVTKNLPLHISNVAFYDEKSKKRSKVGYKIIDTKNNVEKKRVAKISGEIIS